MKFLCKDIDWDTSDEDEHIVELNNLPDDAEVECDSEDYCADALSDEFGFCVKSIGSVVPKPTDEQVKALLEYYSIIEKYVFHASEADENRLAELRDIIS